MASEPDPKKPLANMPNMARSPIARSAKATQRVPVQLPSASTPPEWLDSVQSEFPGPTPGPTPPLPAANFAGTSSVIIIGPSGSGKTVLVGALSHACTHFYNAASRKGLKKLEHVECHDQNENMKNLETRIHQVLDGPLPRIPTDRLIEYKFKLTKKFGLERQHSKIEARITREFEGIYLGWLVRRLSLRKFARALTNISTCQFDMLDGKGGTLFPHEESNSNQDAVEADEQRTILVERLRQATGVIICLDSGAVDPSQGGTAIFSAGLRSVLNDLGRVRWRNVVIALTKADSLVRHLGTRARDKLLRMNPIPILNHCCSRPLIEKLWLTAPEASMAVGFTSVLGFLKDGSANSRAFEGGGEGLLMNTQYCAGNSTDAENAWLPYPVLDPFLFAMTGSMSEHLRKLPRH